MSTETNKSNIFAMPGPHLDICFVVEDLKLYMNKTVLSVSSPVFEKMFEGDFKEKNATEIPLPEKSYEAVVQLFLCIYPSTVKPVTENNFEMVLQLADEYQISSLKERCEAFALNHMLLKKLSNKKLAHYLYLADRHGLNELLETCLKTSLSRKFRNQLQTIESFKLMSVETKLELVTRRLVKLEDSVFGILGKKSDLSAALKRALQDDKCYETKHSHFMKEEKYCDRCRQNDISSLKRTITSIEELSELFAVVHEPVDLTRRRRQCDFAL